MQNTMVVWVKILGEKWKRGLLRGGKLHKGMGGPKMNLFGLYRWVGGDRNGTICTPLIG